MRIALFLSGLLLPFSAYADKVVQSVRVDLDGDGVVDTVSELDVGKQSNVLRIQLSKTKQTLEFANLLPNPNFGEKNDNDPNILKVPAAGEDGPWSSVEVTRKRGGKGDSCDYGCTTHQSSFRISMGYFDHLMIESLHTRDYTYAHADGRNTTETSMDFFWNAVGVLENCGYSQPDERSRRAALDDTCQLSLADFDKTGAAPACAQSALAKLWSTLWPADEDKGHDSFFCRHGKSQ